MCIEKKFFFKLKGRMFLRTPVSPGGHLKNTEITHSSFGCKHLKNEDQKFVYHSEIRNGEWDSNASGQPHLNYTLKRHLNHLPRKNTQTV